MAGAPDNDRLSDVARIRQVLARELETINEYEAHAAASSTPEVRAFFLHLAAEEKEHVAEATHMLRLLDTAQDAHFVAPMAADHFQQALAGKQAAPTAPPPPSVHGNDQGRRASEPPPSTVPPQRLIYGMPAPPPPGQVHPLTVGSLRRGGGEGGGRGGR